MPLLLPTASTKHDYDALLAAIEYPSGFAEVTLTRATTWVPLNLPYWLRPGARPRVSP